MLPTIRRRITVAITSTLLLMILLPLTTSPQTAFASSAADYNGIWEGYGTYNDGRSSFDMHLQLSKAGNQVWGSLSELTYSSEVLIAGDFYAQKGYAQIAFTDYEAVTGNGIQLNCQYRAILSSDGRKMNGIWYYPNHTQPDGSFFLHEVNSWV